MSTIFFTLNIPYHMSLVKLDHLVFQQMTKSTLCYIVFYDYYSVVLIMSEAGIKRREK